MPVVRLDGNADMVGLEQALTDAHLFQGLAADAPPVTAALHRLLVAVLHRVFGPADSATWGRLWDEKQLDAEAIRDYLTGVKGSFDLFDLQRPFFQCPTLEASGDANPAVLLPFAANGNNVTLFDHHHSERKPVLPAAVAARWLVTLQAFDVGGAKSYDVVTSTSKEKYAKAAPLSPLACIQVTGDTLRDTLLLNLVPYDTRLGVPIPCDHDAPVWERTPPDPAPAERVPHGYLDLLTWPSRRIRLTPVTLDEPQTELLVAAVILTPGDRWPDPIDVHESGETMAAFRKNPKAKPGEIAWRPLRLEEDRALWRNATALLATGIDDVQRPKLLDALAEYRQSGVARLPAVLRVHAYGLRASQSNYLFWRDEVLALPPALLDPANRRLATIAEEAVVFADAAGDAISKAEFRVMHALASSSPSPIGAARLFWAVLDSPYTVLLAQLGDAATTGDPALAAHAWAATVVRAVSNALSRFGRIGSRGRELEACAIAETACWRRVRSAEHDFLAVAGADS